MESLLSLLRMHWDHEPTPKPHPGGERTGRGPMPVPLLGGVGGGSVHGEKALTVGAAWAGIGSGQPGWDSRHNLEYSLLRPSRPLREGLKLTLSWLRRVSELL